MRMDTVQIESDLWIIRIYNWQGNKISETRTSEERLVSLIEGLYKQTYHITVHHK